MLEKDSVKHESEVILKAWQRRHAYINWAGSNHSHVSRCRLRKMVECRVNDQDHLKVVFTRNQAHWWPSSSFYKAMCMSSGPSTLGCCWAKVRSRTIAPICYCLCDVKILLWVWQFMIDLVPQEMFSSCLAEYWVEAGARFINDRAETTLL